MKNSRHCEQTGGLRGTCRRITGIAWLTVRTAMRSRLFISLVIVLAVVVIGLPMTLKGDGTPAGHVRVLLYYTLGLAGFLLALVTLWTSCGAVAQEVEEKHIQLVLSKPVRPSHIWFGKWLGILFLNATLLVMSGTAVLLQVHWYTALQLGSDEQQRLKESVLVGRRAWRTAPDFVEDEVDARYSAIEEHGGPTEAAAIRSLRQEIRKQVIAEQTVVAPGRARNWTLAVPRYRRITQDTPLTLRYRLSSTGHARHTSDGVWRIGTQSEPRLIEVPAEEMRPGAHELSLPTAPLLEHIRRGCTLVVELQNTSTQTTQPMVLDPHDPVRLLAAEGSFAANLARALLVILCYMALIAALGLAAGSGLSFPVASFVASALLVMALMVHYFTSASADDGGCRHHHEHGQECEPSAWEQTSERIIKHADKAVAPILGYGPLGMLSDGILVSWRFVGGAAGILGLGYPALCWLLSAWLLHRREVALPT